MARLPAYIRVEVEVGPALRTCLDVLELGGELLELIPEWHVAERDELESRIAGLTDRSCSMLRGAT